MLRFIGTTIATIADQARRLRRRWRRWRSMRRARVAFQKRLLRARGAGAYWSSVPGGGDVFVRNLTAAELREHQARPPAPRWDDRRRRRIS